MRGERKYKIRLNIDQKIHKSNKIIQLVNDYFGVNSTLGNRKSEIVLPRQIAIYLIRQNIVISYNEIGRLFFNKKGGNLNHSTMIFANNKIQSLLDFDKEIQRYVNDLKEDAKNIANLTDLEFIKLTIKDDILDILKDADVEFLDKIKKNILKSIHNRDKKSILAE